MDFVFEAQCDEMVDYRPTDADWAEYAEWLAATETEES